MNGLTIRRLLLAATLVVGVLVGIVVAGVLYFSDRPRREDYAHRTAFDPLGWQSRLEESDPAWPIRLRMVDDLVDRKHLDGLGREGLRSFLGPADTTDKWKDWDVVYWLGPNRGGFRIDSEWLVIRFDQAGKVAEYEIVED